MSWKEKFSFLCPPFVEHVVGDQTFKFYPLSVKVAFQLQSLAGPLLDALTVLFSKSDADVASSAEYNEDGSLKRVQNDAISAEMVKLRTEQRQSAMKKAITALLNPSNAEVAGCLVADSMRDDLPRDMPTAEKRAFVESMTTANLTEILVGMFKANQKVFAPLVKNLAVPVERGLKAAGLRNPLVQDQE